MLSCKQSPRSFMVATKYVLATIDHSSSIRTKVGRKLSTLQAPHRPELWLNAVSKLDMSQLRENLITEAWKGDKILAATLAEVLWNDDFRRENMTGLTVTAGSATKLFKKTLSNRALQQRARYILAPVDGASKYIEGCSTHAAGTLVEAAAAHVHDRDRNAVKDLMTYFVKRVINPNISNEAKRSDITFKIYRVGGPDHKPKFEAIAFWNNFSARGFGHRKKEAENAAVNKLNGMF